MNKYKLIALLLLIVGAPLYAQKKVTGLVCDGENAPLIGATVMVKGTTNGTIVDVNGTYTLRRLLRRWQDISIPEIILSMQ